MSNGQGLNYVVKWGLNMTSKSTRSRPVFVTGDLHLTQGSHPKDSPVSAFRKPKITIPQRFTLYSLTQSEITHRPFVSDPSVCPLHDRKMETQTGSLGRPSGVSPVPKRRVETFMCCTLYTYYERV